MPEVKTEVTKEEAAELHSTLAKLFDTFIRTGTPDPSMVSLDRVEVGHNILANMLMRSEANLFHVTKGMAEAKIGHEKCVGYSGALLTLTDRFALVESNPVHIMELLFELLAGVAVDMQKMKEADLRAFLLDNLKSFLEFRAEAGLGMDNNATQWRH